jgi:hypothetical protein
MHKVWDFCFIDARTVLLAVTIAYGYETLQIISLPLDKGGPSGAFLDLPSLDEDHQYACLQLQTDGGRLIGLCVGIDIRIQYEDIRDSGSDYLLVIDRPGLLKLLGGAQGTMRANWAEWESKVTAILPIGTNSYQMGWAVLGRRIVINAKAETFPFAKTALGIKVKDEAEDNSQENDENGGSDDLENSHYEKRLVVVDFGSYRPTSVVEAGDESGNIIRCRPQEGVSLTGVCDTTSQGLPYRIWMERVPSCLPNQEELMSENMVFLLGVSYRAHSPVRLILTVNLQGGPREF